MRVVIDMQGAQTESRFRGIGRYTTSFVKALAATRGNNEIVLALNGMLTESIDSVRDEFEGLLPPQAIRVWHAVPPVRSCDAAALYASRRKVADTIREWFLCSLRPDILHITSMCEGFGDDAVTGFVGCGYEVLRSVSFYDAIPQVYSEEYLRPDPLYAAFYREKAAQFPKADILLAISESSRQEAVSHFGITASKVVNVSTDADPQFCVLNSKVDEQSAQRYGLVKPFVLYTGGFDRRKNLPRLIQAFASLSPMLRASHQLAIVGRCDGPIQVELLAIAKRSGLTPDAIVFCGFVEDADLVTLYRTCRLCVLPSLHEGFGLPALEGMRCGAPVIGANSSSIAEVIALSDALFDPYSKEDITRVMQAGLENEAFRERIRTHGMQRAKEFSWTRTAESAWVAWERLYREHRDERHVDWERAAPQSLTKAVGAALAAEDVQAAAPLSQIASAIALTAPPNNRQRCLFVDISELSQRDAKTGVQRVTRAVLAELLRSPPSDVTVVPVYATIDRPGYRHATAFASRTFGWLGDELDGELIEPAPGDLFLGLDLQHHVVLAQQEWLNRMARYGVVIWFVIYDLLPLQFPECFPPGAAQGHSEWLSVVTAYDGVSCISRAVADDVTSWVRSSARRRRRPLAVRWFHQGNDFESSVPTKGAPEDAGQFLGVLTKRPSFLMVGTLEPRKGHAQVLAAFETLWNDGVDANLVLVGKAGWQIEALQHRLECHSEKGRRLFWVNSASDEYLTQIYERVDCLIMASRGEGFGLPLIEAARHDVPILARDLPVFREVAADQATYFTGDAPADLAEAICEWLSAKKQGTAPSSGEMRALTWHESVDQLLGGIGMCRSCGQTTSAFVMRE